MTVSRNILAPRKQWQQWELDLLTELYPQVEAAAIAWFCNCSLSAVYQQAARLSLKKDISAVAAMARERMTPDHPASAHQFKPGNVSHNKGKRGINYPGAMATQFKPGNKPHTWLPIGTERISKDGYLQRKITETGYSPRDWVAVHILIWQEHTGKTLPKGHAIIFLDGNKRNFDPDNLACITRAELMRRNTIHRYPQPLRLAIRQVATLKRKINEKQDR